MFDQMLINLVWDKVYELGEGVIPQKFNLDRNHIETLEESGIGPESAAAAGIFSANEDLAEKLTGHRRAGLIFTYFTHDGKGLIKRPDGKPFFRIRPNERIPGFNYLSPKDGGVHLYYPRVPRLKLFNDDGSTKQRDTLTITEGEKKALCLALNGFPCIGLGGVSSYCTGPRGGSGQRSLGGLVEDIDLRSFRSVVVMFDSDVTQKWQVQAAIRSIGFEILSAYEAREINEAIANGGNSEIEPERTLRLAKALKYGLLPNCIGDDKDPDQKVRKVGVDDAIVAFGIDDVGALIKHALPLMSATWKDPGDGLQARCLFAIEPGGDDHPKGSPMELIKTYRALLAHLAIKSQYVTADGFSHLKYSPDLGIWERISGEQWYNLPEVAADLNDWISRGKPLTDQQRRYMNHRLTIPAKDLDPTGVIGFTNGVLPVNGSVGKLQPFSPSYMLTQRLGFEYEPEASCETWLKWLDWTFGGSEEKVELMQALFRWTLEPKGQEAHAVQVWPILIGPSGTGKGTFLEVLQGLLGKSFAAWSYSTMSDANGLLRLCNKKAAIAAELKGSLTTKIAETINMVASNEVVEVKALYQNCTDTRLCTVPWAAMNEPIQSSIVDKKGLNRRILYIQFARKPEAVDHGLGKKLAGDLPGIFNWVWSMSLNEAIETIKTYMASEGNLATQREFLESSNSVYEWLAEQDFPSEVRGSSRMYYDQYKTWALSCSYHPLGFRHWRDQMVSGGAKEARSSGKRELVIPAFKDTDARTLLGIPG